MPALAMAFASECMRWLLLWVVDGFTSFERSLNGLKSGFGLLEEAADRVELFECMGDSVEVVTCS